MVNKYVLVNEEARTKSEIIKYICQYASDNNIYELKSEMESLIINREQIGNTLISENIAIPHLESFKLKESCFIVTDSRKYPIKWNEDNDEVSILIVLCINENTESKVINEVKSFLHLIADESFEKKLLSSKTKQEFESLIKKS